jgi:hypothetical protein
LTCSYRRLGLLIIISDIHLGDGTCGKTIIPVAFQLFIDRLKEMSHNASQRADGIYRPINTIDILLLGDILDPLHSTRWLENNPGSAGYVRPWSDYRTPEFATKLSTITQAILKNNQESISLLKSLTKGIITLPQANSRDKSKMGGREIPVKVRLHYMVGNHDWYYHIPGRAFDKIRAEIIAAFGLFNSSNPFPYELRESNELAILLERYKVFAQHGDVYDSFNYNKKLGRDAASLGDAFAVEILNRFPVEVEQQLGGELPRSFIENLRELVNIRPPLATPLWISSQLRYNNIPQAKQKKLKELWDGMSREFLKLEFVREANVPFRLDYVDGLEIVIGLTDMLAFKTLDKLAVWVRKKFASDRITFAQHALKEGAFLDRKAQFVVYGHTHHHEVVALDSYAGANLSTNQMYLNSGTWHTYHDLAINKPEEQKFIPYQVLTYLTFYQDDERQGRLFETWSGSFSD